MLYTLKYMYYKCIFQKSCENLKEKKKKKFGIYSGKMEEIPLF